MSKNLASTTWLSQSLTNKNLVLLDASPKATVSGKKSKYPDLAISGARHFDLKGDFVDRDSPFPNTVPSDEQFQDGCRKLGINQDSHIVIYDNMGIYTSPRVWWLFKVMGHQNVSVLDGGLPEWINQGHQTIASKDIQTNYDEGNFLAKRDDNQIIRFQDIVDNAKSQDFTILDARSAGRFAGVDPEPRKYLKSGQMECSLSLPFSSVLDDGKFKSKAELQKVFAKVKRESSRVVYSCGSGLTACIIMLAAHQIGVESIELYDGSWTEYAEKKKLIVEQ